MSTNHAARVILRVMDDAELILLVKRAVAGDRQAFSDLAADYWHRLIALARSIIAHHEAEDMVQEALIVAWQRLDTLRQPAAFGSWLTRIVANTALHRARRQRHMVDLESAPEAPAACNPGPAAELDSRLDVQRLLAWLSPRQRAVMHLTHIQGCSDREIANLLGISASSVRGHRLRARTRLLELISGGGS
jgi:RNA polymerase sigma-70 factor (ECF subfamily)